MRTSMETKLRLLLTAGALTFASVATGQPAVGDVLDDAELASAAGGKAHLLGKGQVSVVLFFRPGQDFSTTTLADFATMEKEFAGKPLWMVGVVGDRFPPAEIAAAVKTAGIKMPVLLDKDDTIYGKWKLVQHPAVVVLDDKRKVLAFEPFARINYGHVLRARIQHALKEITDEQLDAVIHPVATRGTVNHAAHRQLKMAERLLDGGNAEKAAESARKAIEADATLADAHALLGAALAAQGDCKGALASFKQALTLDKENARALAGKPLCEGKGK